MSQASKHVEWCLKKAEKEIEELEKQGKRAKHRGLLKIHPNVNTAKEHIEKAEHNLSVTNYLLKGNFSDASMGTIFYTMYQCFLAIATKFGYESKNQTCTIALIEYLKEQGNIDLNDKFIEYFKYKEDNGKKDSIIDMREDYTYGTYIKVDKSKIDFFLKECRELIDKTREIIFN